MTTPSLCRIQFLLGIRIVCLLERIPGGLLSYFRGNAKDIIKVHWSYSPQLEHHSFSYSTILPSSILTSVEDLNDLFKFCSLSMPIKLVNNTTFLVA